jgi:HK97 family phage major capsid protein
MKFPVLHDYLRRYHGLRDNATDGDAKELGRSLVRSGKLTVREYGQLCAGTGSAADQVPSLEAIDAAAERVAKSLLTRGTDMRDSRVQPTDLFRHSVDVKAPSARYSTKRYEAKHVKTGQPVMREGAAVDMPSERDKALTGVYFRHLALRKGLNVRPLNEHEQEMLKELYNDGLWCGDVGGQYYPGAKLQDIFRRKGSDLIGDSTSGGSNLIPYFFDTDIVTFPLLNGELFPYVDLKELTWSNSVHTASIANVTAAWGASEGSANAINLQTTDGLVAGITANVYDVAMAITIGRDFLSDSPVNVGAEINTLMGRELTYQLDKVIAGGDGVTQPQGLVNAAGTVAVTAKNSTAGPFVVADVESMISSLPKQYRSNEPSICWVMNDKAWFRLRGISVSGTDQRRIFGYDYERYMLTSRPVRIQNDLPANDIFFLKMLLYRMWRRMGMQIEMSTEGRTLMLDNELLIVGRGRYAGKLLDGGGCCFMSNAPLH